MHKVRLLYLVPLMVTVSMFFSCSFDAPQEEQELNDSTQFNSSSLTIDIFAAHGFLGGSSYERYYLENNKLWRECGELTENEDDSKDAKPSAFPEVFAAHKSILPKDACFDTLTTKQLAAVARAVQSVKTTSSNTTAVREHPGSLFSLSSGGAFESKITLSGSPQSVSTTLTAVSNAESGRDQALNELYSLLRGVGREMCGSKIFFGIGRKR